MAVCEEARTQNGAAEEHGQERGASEEEEEKEEEEEEGEKEEEEESARAWMHTGFVDFPVDLFNWPR